MSAIPDLPGNLVHPSAEQELKNWVSRLCNLDYRRFPGSQPVSLTVKDLEKLEAEDFWVCEKSDGVRVLFLIQTHSECNAQSLYLIDRHNTYREVSGIFFPHHENPLMPLKNTLVDAELVIDIDPRTKHKTLRLLTFDCLVVDDQNVMSRPLDKRYGRLSEWFYKPYSKMLQDHPRMADTQPFQIKVKDTNLSYHVEKVFNVDIPTLEHGSDGLIYTCVNAPYVTGTDVNIMKWKPPSENSIDFKLVLRFPPVQDEPSEPDYFVKPIFFLYVWCGLDDSGQSRYEQYDELHMDDYEWEKLKLSRVQVHDRIVEVRWDWALSRWRFMRFRDDKPDGNHQSVVDKIIQSIVDGVEKDTLLSRCSTIRSAWKLRQGQSDSKLQYQVKPPVTMPQLHPEAHYGPSYRIGITGSAAGLKYGPFVKARWSRVAGPSSIEGVMR